MTASAQPNYPAEKAVDGDDQTMWVSNGWKEGDSPTPQRPEWLQLEYPQPITTETLWITPKSPFGPRDIEVQSSSDGKTFTTLKKQSLKRDGEQVIPVPPTRSQIFRILVTGSYTVENCQIAEVGLTHPAKAVRPLAGDQGRTGFRQQYGFGPGRRRGAVGAATI